MDEYLAGQLGTIRNLTNIAQILINLGKFELLPTILELIYQESQDMVNTYCVVEE